MLVRVHFGETARTTMHVKERFVLFVLSRVPSFALLRLYDLNDRIEKAPRTIPKGQVNSRVLAR